MDNYIRAVERAGGVPVPGYAPEPDPHCLGLVLCGGGDLDPAWFGQEDRGSHPPDPRRDEAELALVRTWLSWGRPILGICRGMQVINAGLGGTLYQDLSENPLATIKHSQDAPGNFPSHHLTVELDSRLFDLMGHRPFVNSRHHQGLKKIAPGVKVVASADDGVPEAIESIAGNQILAVQWHPENMYKHYPESQRLFADLIDRARAVQAKR